MSSLFYSLKVIRKEVQTSDAFVFYFEIPANIQSNFTYLAGQYLTFEALINGEKVRRSYSICTSPLVDAEIGVAVKRVENGKMSNWMNDHLNVGSVIDVMPPMGKFVLNQDQPKPINYVLWAGGSGITPILGLAKSILKAETNSTVTLVYANRNQQSVIFKPTWDLLEKEYSSLHVLYSYDSAPLTWFGLKGFLTPDKVATICNNKIKTSAISATHFICGPSGMMDAVKTGLSNLSVPTNLVNTEYFTAPTQKTPSADIATEIVEPSFTGVAEIALTVYGKTFNVTCNKDTTILKAAMDQGIDPPYSCTVGVCTTCRAKVKIGNVHMLEREGLSDQEIDEGYVLTCQAVPLSAKIELVFE